MRVYRVGAALLPAGLAACGTVHNEPANRPLGGSPPPVQERKEILAILLGGS